MILRCLFKNLAGKHPKETDVIFLWPQNRGGESWMGSKQSKEPALKVRLLHPEYALTPPTLNLPDPPMGPCRIQSWLSLWLLLTSRKLSQDREGALWSSGSCEDPADWSCFVPGLQLHVQFLEKETLVKNPEFSKAWLQRPQWSTCPGSQKKAGTGFFWVPWKKPLCDLFFLLPSFVFTSFALKMLLITISVQFEMQA